MKKDVVIILSVIIVLLVGIIIFQGLIYTRHDLDKTCIRFRKTTIYRKTE